MLFDANSGLTNLNLIVSGSKSTPDDTSTYDRITRQTAFNVINAIKGAGNAFHAGHTVGGEVPWRSGVDVRRKGSRSCWSFLSFYLEALAPHELERANRPHVVLRGDPEAPKTPRLRPGKLRLPFAPPTPMMFVSAAEAGWPDVTLGEQVENVAPQWLKDG